jgi:transposase
MLSFPSAVKIYLCKQPTDMRRSFDSLAMMVQCVIKQDPLTGHMFMFRNKRGNCIKLLYWDRDGYAIWYKRLEKGTFNIPVDITEDCRLEHYQLSMILEGIELTGIKRKKRFSLSAQNTSKHAYA